MAMIEMIEIIHFNEAWQRYTKACGNCHGSLNVVAGTTQPTSLHLLMILISRIFILKDPPLLLERLYVVMQLPITIVLLIRRTPCSMLLQLQNWPAKIFTYDLDPLNLKHDMMVPSSKVTIKTNPNLGPILENISQRDPAIKGIYWFKDIILFF